MASFRSDDVGPAARAAQPGPGGTRSVGAGLGGAGRRADIDRKSTRLNSSHVKISYAVFSLKKKSPEINLFAALVRIKQSKLIVFPRAQCDPVDAIATHDSQAIERRVLFVIADEKPHPRISK